MKKLTYPLLCALISASALLAQDYEQVAPKTPVPNAPSSIKQPEPSAGSDKNADQVLLKELKAFIFLPSPKDVQAKGATTNDLIDLSRVTVPDPEDLKKIACEYVGKPLTKSKLNQLIRDIILYYRDHDRPIVDVIVPQQDITEGFVQIVLLEGKTGNIKVDGNKWFSTSSIFDSIGIKNEREKTGKSISSNQLLDNLDAINQNPFRSADVVFSQGSEVGVTDITYKVQDRFPVRFYAGYENTGNALTGEDRYLAGFNWGDAFFQGHQLNYQYIASHDFSELEAHSGSYIIPLPWWHHTLTFFGSNSSSAGMTTGFDVKGSGSQLGVRYDIPLPRIQDTYTHKFTLGYDWKQSDNSLEFGAAPVNASTVDVGQYVFGYTGTIKDEWGVTSFNPQIICSPSRVWKYQNDVDYQSVRAGASAHYAYFKLNASRLTRLPLDFSLSHEFTYQKSNHNLLPSEQLNMGGNSSIRGYNEWDISGTDHGWTLRNELRTPPVALLHYLHNDSRMSDQLQFLAFFDCGQAQSHDGAITLNNGKSADSLTMASVGPGVRYNISQYLSAYADYGFQLYDTGDTSASRWHMGLTLSY